MKKTGLTMEQHRNAGELLKQTVPALERFTHELEISSRLVGHGLLARNRVRKAAELLNAAKHHLDELMVLEHPEQLKDITRSHVYYGAPSATEE